MAPNQTVQLLIPMASLYVTLLMVIFTLAPVYEKVIQYFVLPMRHLRYFTEVLTGNLAIQLLVSYGPKIINHEPNGFFLTVENIPIQEAAEMLVGIMLVTLLWRSRGSFYQLEQIGLKYRDHR